MAEAATASGGATTAPIASDAGQEIPGRQRPWRRHDVERDVRVLVDQVDPDLDADQISGGLTHGPCRERVEQGVVRLIAKATAAPGDALDITDLAALFADSPVA